MKKQIRTIGVLVFALVGLIAFSGGVYAASPDGDDPQAVQEIIDRLWDSEDPHQEFSQLSPSEQAAVVDYLQVATVEEYVSTTSGAGGASDEPDHRCRTNSKTIRAKSRARVTLYTYASRTYWCWNGTEITNDPHFTRDAEVSAPFWEFVGHTDKSESGGEGDWEHRDYTEGHFRLCFPALGCYRIEYPDITKIQRADGSSRAY